MNHSIITEAVISFCANTDKGEMLLSELVSIVRAEYGVMDGSRVAAKHRDLVDKIVTGAVGNYYGFAVNDKNQLVAAGGDTATARKRKSRILKAIFESEGTDPRKKTKSTFVSLKQQIERAVDNGKLTTKQRETLATLLS